MSLHVTYFRTRGASLRDSLVPSRVKTPWDPEVCSHTSGDSGTRVSGVTSVEGFRQGILHGSQEIFGQHPDSDYVRRLVSILSKVSENPA